MTRSVARDTKILHTLGDREFILSVATFERQKGLDVLLTAFAELRNTRPQLALALVGRPNGAEVDLRLLAAELDIAGDVFFFESVPRAQVCLFLERAKAFCLPSRAEGFGIVILEAGAYCLPVVASRTGGIPEIIHDGETGLLVPPDDPRALAVALNRVLADSDLARHLGERLRQRVLTDFTWTSAYQRYRALLS